MPIEEDVVIFIANRRRNRRIVYFIWTQLEQDLRTERKLVERDMVAFLWDMFYLAMERITHSKRNTFFRSSIKDGSPTFQALMILASWVEEAKINPFSFFLWAIEQRRLKKIPPSVINICSKNTFSHFVYYLGKNQYRVRSCAQFTDYENQLENQLEIDLITFITYQLRKSKIVLEDSDFSLFSSPARALLSIKGFSIALKADDELFQEDLQFDPEFLKRLEATWLRLIDKHRNKVKLQKHEALSDIHTARINNLLALLEVFKGNIDA